MDRRVGLAGMTDNADIAAALRQVADWLEEHPGLPDAFASVSLAWAGRAVTRDDVMTVTEAIGEDAVEIVDGPRLYVHSGLRFDGVHVFTWTTVRDLGAEEVPECEPIVADPRWPV